jgi:alkanesulfonate monooxygenase SsuD/methylene tetrahydromethanopterin reductase-like flavin-dependent oxidoreductase (luciferase family)
MVEGQEGATWDEWLALARACEDAGLEALFRSDHYLSVQDHPERGSLDAWATLAALAHATERIRLGTLVSPATFRHPSVLAKMVVTADHISRGRVELGIGAGWHEPEHRAYGFPFPPDATRLEMLEEQLQIVRRSWEPGPFDFEGRHYRVRGLDALPKPRGGYVTYDGEFFDVQSAKVWDLPAELPPIGIAVSGDQSCRLAGELADLMIAVEPNPKLAEAFDAAGGGGKPRVGQVPVCYDADEKEAVRRAHEQFRWFGGGWRVNAELPGPSAFAAASRFVTEDDVAAAIPCGPDAGRHVEAIRTFVDAGFTHVALVQVGGDHQEPFARWFADELRPALAAEGVAAGG